MNSGLRQGIDPAMMATAISAVYLMGRRWAVSQHTVHRLDAGRASDVGKGKGAEDTYQSVMLALSHM